MFFYWWDLAVISIQISQISIRTTGAIHLNTSKDPQIMVKDITKVVFLPIRFPNGVVIHSNMQICLMTF